MLRRTPLVRRTPLRRRAALRRRASLPTRPPTRLDGPFNLDDVRYRWALWNRSRGLCDVGGEPLSPRAWDPHHRKQRSLGGTDEPSNVLVVCRAHHDRIHDRIRWAHDNGYLVHSRDDPLLVDVILHGRTRVRLTNDVVLPF